MRPYLALFLLALPLPAAAQNSVPARLGDPFNFGTKQFTYRVGVKLEETWDNNLFLSERGEERENFSTLVPMLKMRWDYAEQDYSYLNYTGRLNRFAKYDEFDGMEHSLDLFMRVTVGVLRIDVGDEYRNRKEPFDLLQVTERLDSVHNWWWATAAFDLNRFDLEFTYSGTRFSIDEVDQGNFRRREYSVLLAADMWTKTAVFLEARQAPTEYVEEVFADFVVRRLVVGLRGEPSEKTRINARAGLARLENDEEVGRVPSDEYTGLVYGIAFQWKATERGLLKLEFIHQPMESVLTGSAVSDKMSASYDQQHSETFKYGGSVEWSRQEESDGSFDRSGWTIVILAEYRFARQFLADLKLLHRFKMSDADGSDFDDTRATLGVGVEW